MAGEDREDSGGDGVMRGLAVALVMASSAVWAGAQIIPLGEPDKYGAINYSVKCETGGGRIVQCVRDDQHCGYAGEQTLAAVVELACGGSQATGDQAAPMMETSPASP
jgi:hypothetical protein